MPLDFKTLFKSNIITTDAIFLIASVDYNKRGMFLNEYEAAEIMEIEIESSNPIFEINNDELVGSETDDGTMFITVDGTKYKVFQIIKLSEPITRFILSYDE